MNEVKKKEDRLEICQNYFVRKYLKHDYGKYETRLLLITQLGYIPVAASMLLTTFLEPSDKFCKYLNTTRMTAKDLINSRTSDEFYSITVELDLVCQASSNQITTFLSSLLMWGALIGSFCCGYLSDSIGRKPVFSGCLALISVVNFLLCIFNNLSWYIVSTLLLILGFSCGGYMVTNFVILTEAFELPRSRLLAVSLNGWSASMTVTAVIAWMTKKWFTYHFVTFCSAILLFCLAKFFCFESCRWLAAMGRVAEAKDNAERIIRINGTRQDPNEVEDLEWYEVLAFSPPVQRTNSSKWTSLFTTKSLLKPSLVMFYCFAASSIVSFGFYFSLDVLPGNRYANLAFMGIFKFVLGFTPFWLSNYLAKKSIAIVSVGLCCISALLILPIEFLNIVYLKWAVSVLSLAVAAGMDPTWKINHLYSTELFPTSVRSMGRGVCNVGGRLGSVIAPMIVFTRSFNSSFPFLIFSILLIVQWLVIVAFLPNDSEKQTNELPED